MQNDKVNLLLIEDNPGDARLVRDLLTIARPEKYVISTVETLKQATDCLHQNDYDIILSDLSLPDSDGFNIISVILSLNDNIPIVVLSGQDSDELAINVVQMGAQDYLVKGQGDGYLINRSIDYAIERKKIVKGLNYLVQNDSLTGLSNRRMFKERVNHAISRADRNKSMMALMFIDLDKFKNINDTFGHDVGDELLIKFAERLRECLREIDTVARLGGDEFTVLLEDIKQAEDPSKVAANIIESMADKFIINQQEIYMSVSIGIAIYPQDANNHDSLMKAADIAMYLSKNSGQNNYRFYTPEMNERIIERANMEMKIRRAIDHHEFHLCYQPKFDINSMALVGAEALIRWIDPEEGIISPDCFIPVAEEAGLIGPITEWVIKEACSQASQWQKEGYAPFRMAINLSPIQFNQENIADLIVGQIHDTGLSPNYVELEITEGALVEEFENSNGVLHNLKMKGVKVSIDDFGTGYSSLSYLRKFQIDTLKIDQSFIKDILVDEDDAAIVAAIIAMATSLRLNVIAEGVESQEQLDYLKESGCHEVQGYHLGYPANADEFTRYLVKNPD